MGGNQPSSEGVGVRVKLDQPAIGVDLGATKIAAALVAPDGQVLASRQAPTGAAEGPEAVLARLATMIDGLAAQAPGTVAGVGVGSPGLVDQANGVIYNAVNLGWEKVPLVSGVRDRMSHDLPIRIEKDTNASALGEYYFGGGRGCPDFVYVSIGSGLGGGVIAGGRLVSGANGYAAELGHLSIDPEGPQCVCGLRGCSETIVSGPGLVTVTRNRLLRADVPGDLSATDDLTPAKILKAAHQGDRLAQAAFADLGAALGTVLAACVAVLNPALFVVGGGLGLAGFDLFIPAAQRELERRVPPMGWRELQIIPSQLASSAIGPACLVWQ